MPARRSFSFGHFAVKLAWSFQISLSNPSRGGRRRCRTWKRVKRDWEKRKRKLAYENVWNLSRHVRTEGKCAAQLATRLAARRAKRLATHRGGIDIFCAYSSLEVNEFHSSTNFPNEKWVWFLGLRKWKLLISRSVQVSVFRRHAREPSLQNCSDDEDPSRSAQLASILPSFTSLRKKKEDSKRLKLENLKRKNHQ